MAWVDAHAGVNDLAAAVDVAGSGLGGSLEGDSSHIVVEGGEGASAGTQPPATEETATRSALRGIVTEGIAMLSCLPPSQSAAVLDQLAGSDSVLAAALRRLAASSAPPTPRSVGSRPATGASNAEQLSSFGWGPDEEALLSEGLQLLDMLPASHREAVLEELGHAPSQLANTLRGIIRKSATGESSKGGPGLLAPYSTDEESLMAELEREASVARSGEAKYTRDVAVGRDADVLEEAELILGLEWSDGLALQRAAMASVETQTVDFDGEVTTHAGRPASAVPVENTSSEGQSSVGGDMTTSDQQDQLSEQRGATVEQNLPDLASLQETPAVPGDHDTGVGAIRATENREAGAGEKPSVKGAELDMDAPEGGTRRINASNGPEGGRGAHAGDGTANAEAEHPSSAGDLLAEAIRIRATLPSELQDVVSLGNAIEGLSEIIARQKQRSALAVATGKEAVVGEEQDNTLYGEGGESDGDGDAVEDSRDAREPRYVTDEQGAMMADGAVGNTDVGIQLHTPPTAAGGEIEEGAAEQVNARSDNGLAAVVADNGESADAGEHSGVVDASTREDEVDEAAQAAKEEAAAAAAAEAAAVTREAEERARLQEAEAAAAAAAATAALTRQRLEASVAGHEASLRALVAVLARLRDHWASLDDASLVSAVHEVLRVCGAGERPGTATDTVNLALMVPGEGDVARRERRRWLNAEADKAALQEGVEAQLVKMREQLAAMQSQLDQQPVVRVTEHIAEDGDRILSYTFNRISYHAEEAERLRFEAEMARVKQEHAEREAAVAARAAAEEAFRLEAAKAEVRLEAYRIQQRRLKEEKRRAEELRRLGKDPRSVAERARATKNPALKEGWMSYRQQALPKQLERRWVVLRATGLQVFRPPPPLVLSGHAASLTPY